MTHTPQNSDIKKARDFINGKIKDGQGRSADYYLNDMDEVEMEQSHDWIQWAFPIMDVSEINPTAPRIIGTNYKYGYPAYKFRNQMTDKYLKSIGMCMDYPSSSYPKITIAVSKFLSVIDSPYNHHMCRVSRLMRHLCLTNNRSVAICILRKIQGDVVALAPNNFTSTTIMTWNKILFDNTY